MNQRNPNSLDGADGRNKPPPLIDKTFVEGNDEQRPAPPRIPLPIGTRPDASPIGISNTFTKLPEGAISDLSMLPTGNEKMPLGSGTLAGLLGSGGMARVYKIWNEKLEVFRAVKILLPTRQKDLKSRFETESKITAKLHHPNIVEIYNVGEWKGLPYIEMEFIDGSSLEAIITKYGKLPTVVSSAVSIFIARALVYAHSQEILIYGKTYQGIIHRDLKPANIMLSKTGEVRLMDFGIARPTETSLHTTEGNIVGTMQYLSPEQIDGIDIDGRTDIYSFGAIMYEMITGMKTFPQETVTSLMRHKIVNEYRKFSDFEFAIAPSLARITQKCLHSSKGHRYASAVSLLKDLETVHKLLTLDEPDQVLSAYVRDPEHFVQPESKKKFRLQTPEMNKLLIPLITVIMLVVIVGGFLATVALKSEKSFLSTLIKGPRLTEPPPSPPIVTPVPIPPTVTEETEKYEPLDPQASARPPEVADRPEEVSSAPSKPPRRPPRPPKTPKDAYVKKPVEQPSQTVSLSDASIRRNTLQPIPPEELIERLRQRFGTNDYIILARNCIQIGRPADAITVLENQGENVDPTLKTLTLFEAYIDARRTNEARTIALDRDLHDAQFDYLCGRVYQALGKRQNALDYYASALTKPSLVRKHNDIRDDALYHSALIRDEQYRMDPSSENRKQAVNAWNVVKRLYGTAPTHPRVKMAEESLSSIN